MDLEQNIGTNHRETSSMMSSCKLDSFVLRVFSLSCVRGWELNFDVPSRSAEWIVIPWILNAATPVGAVSNTTTSSGSTCPERSNNLLHLCE